MRKIERQSLKERQVVAFSYAGREGVALCHDSNTFYFAINLGEKEGEITKMDYFPSEGIEFREANYFEKKSANYQQAGKMLVKFLGMTISSVLVF